MRPRSLTIEPRRSAEGAAPVLAKGADVRIFTSVRSLTVVSFRTKGVAKLLIFLVAHVDPADSVDSNFGAHRGRKFPTLRFQPNFPRPSVACPP